MLGWRERLGNQSPLIGSTFHDPSLVVQDYRGHESTRETDASQETQEDGAVFGVQAEIPIRILEREHSARPFVDRDGDEHEDAAVDGEQARRSAADADRLVGLRLLISL